MAETILFGAILPHQKARLIVISVFHDLGRYQALDTYFLH